MKWKLFRHNWKGGGGGGGGGMSERMNLKVGGWRWLVVHGIEREENHVGREKVW